LVTQDREKPYFRHDVPQLFVMKLLLKIVGFLLLWVPLQANAVEKISVTLNAELQREITKLPVIKGDILRTNDLKGQVVLISFFASWCPPCNTEFQHLNDFQAAYRGKPLKIIAINYFEDLGGFKDDGERLDRFIYRHKPKFHVLKGNDALAKQFEDVQRIPTVFIFDQKGQKSLHFIHRYKSKKTNPTTAELETVLNKLLGSPSLGNAPRHPKRH
jgi:thiol-disulfide isomerase/thioredoxin